MPAFAEFFEATLERLGSSVSDAKLDRVLRRWKARTAKEARAVCEVEAYLATADCVNMMRAAAAEACAATGDGGRDVAWYERAVRRRAAFRGVYAPATPLGEALRLSACEIVASQARAVARRIVLSRGHFGAAHASIRAAAHPFTSAYIEEVMRDVESEGSPIVEAVGLGADDEEGPVLGYACLDDESNYLLDLAVDPAQSGAGVGTALLGACGVIAEAAGERTVQLHVHRHNPAAEMYRRCGFETTELRFPDWFDWHGGYLMTAKSADLARLLSTRVPHFRFEIP